MRYRLERLAILVAAAALATLPGAPAGAEKLYRYTDEDGVEVVTNVAPGTSRRAARRTERNEVVRLSSPSPERALPRDVREYDLHIEEACELYRIPVALARAVMAAESNFNPDAISHAGAQGLMQLMPETAAEMFVEDAFDPRQNIHGGVRYLRVLANMFDGDMVKIVAAYNAGPDAVKRAGGKIPKIRETQDYVRKVLKFYFAYKNGS